ncbi:small nucleolar ribonucleoprotein [Coprinopsis cinerea okayama7|uniref:U3 small nucleolar ribonucleoprotein protein MPP10 n=1 Tax=Coprinopsis cinerea (strain Okayama-7 / 130 / ATCC MYA-4618 / FGSC 9003) TaxID=240176 RepID=A8N1Q2_COPC7|nr:small nucleolar ribonucleoprotein [Coprinopsis cinerea okayama7\|eukprot:XP_001828746.1 small nucleolar ribonucleoprotein [Coprinopsis cinerea okayama7\
MAQVESSYEKVFSDLKQKLEKPEQFALGSNDIRSAAIQAAKSVFDVSLREESFSIKHINALLSSLTPFEAPQTRSKSKAGNTNQPSAPSLSFNPTPLASLFVDDLEEEQVWAQLELRTKHICDLLDVVLEGELADPDENDEIRQALESGGFSFDEDDEDEDGEDDELGEDEDDIQEDDSEEESVDDSELLEDGFQDESDEVSDEDEIDGGHQSRAVSDSSEEDEPSPPPARKQRHRKSEVDDDFFDLSEFKAEVERAEAKSSSRGHLAADDDSDDELDDDIDLFAPVDEEGDTEADDAKEIFYSDFFEPPRETTKKPSKALQNVRFHDQVNVKKTAAKKRTLDDLIEEHESGSGSSSPESGEEEEESEFESDDASSMSAQDRVRTTIERLKDDLFADDDEEGPEKDMTTYERRMAALQAQISELEQENVGRKDWALMGEADSRARPQNSLLEEDLDFDRVMKPVPVITEEKVQSLEQLIKTRILENRFDDVVRIRPMDDKAFLPSRILELQDSKSSQSLAQIYEDEYMAAQGDTSKVDDRDGKLRKEHEEIESLWDKLCEKLDALSNAHFVPKQPKSLISAVSDVSTATLESALPTTKSATSMLAPEEVFAAEPSQLRARSELTPAEKRALRTKERKLKKKQRDMLEKTVDKTAKARGVGGVKKQKEAALASIAKHGKGVTVVGKSAKDLKSLAGKRSQKSS